MHSSVIIKRLLLCSQFRISCPPKLEVPLGHILCSAEADRRTFCLLASLPPPPLTCQFLSPPEWDQNRSRARGPASCGRYTSPWPGPGALWAQWVFYMSTFSHVLLFWISQRLLLGITICSPTEKGTILTLRGSPLGIHDSSRMACPFVVQPGHEQHPSLTIHFAEIFSAAPSNVSCFIRITG